MAGQEEGKQVAWIVSLGSWSIGLAWISTGIHRQRTRLVVDAVGIRRDGPYGGMSKSEQPCTVAVVIVGERLGAAGYGVARVAAGSDVGPSVAVAIAEIASLPSSDALPLSSVSVHARRYVSVTCLFEHRCPLDPSIAASWPNSDSGSKGSPSSRTHTANPQRVDPYWLYCALSERRPLKAQHAKI